MKERTKEELLEVYNGPFRRNYVICEIIDQLLVEMEKPRVWSDAPSWATAAKIEWTDSAYYEDATKQEYSDMYHRTLPKTRAREIAEETKEAYHKADGSEMLADMIESAILRREKELEEGR